MKKYIIKYAVMACLSLGLAGTAASCTRLSGQGTRIGCHSGKCL